MYTDKEIQKRLREIQPRLWDVAPLTALIIIGFAVMNTVLGVGMLTQTARVQSTLLVVNSVMTYEVWGTIFLVTGIAGAVTYIFNDWRAMRTLLVVGVFLKFWWLAAIISRMVIGSSDNIILFCLWGLLCYVQIVTYIKFTPEIKKHD